MPVLLNSGEDVLDVVPDVPAELEVGRTRVGQTPVFQRAHGLSEQFGELVLGEKRRGDLRCRVHTERCVGATGSYPRGP